MDRNKNCLFGEPVDYDQNSIKPRGWWEFLDKVHRSGIPWLFEDKKLFERSVGLMMLWLGWHTSDAMFLTITSSKNMVMIILENICVEITSGWYIDSVVKEEKTIWICRLLAIYRNVFCSNWVTRESQRNVFFYLLMIVSSFIRRKVMRNQTQIYFVVTILFLLFLVSRPNITNWRSFIFLDQQIITNLFY